MSNHVARRGSYAAVMNGRVQTARQLTFGPQTATARDRSAWSRRRVLVTRLDRPARSTRDLLNVVATVAEKGAGFRSIADSWADSTTPHGRLMLTVLGGLAEFERELIRARTDEGRKRAMARGVRFGRKPKLSPSAKIRSRYFRGEYLTSIIIIMIIMIIIVCYCVFGPQLIPAKQRY